MKFKPIYFYGLLAVAFIAILIFVTRQGSSEPNEIPINNNQNMPEDDVHKQLRNQGSNLPSKENVSEEYRKRLTEMKDATEKNPQDTLAMKNYADFLTASHNMNEAIQLYEKILTVDPRRADIHFALAVIYYTKQDFVKSEEENNKVLALDSNNQMALYNLGAIAATKGDVTKAKDMWNRVIKINSKSETGKLAKEFLGKLN